MILTCSKCKTQYAVPEEAITEGGKKVKCTSCGHIWLQKPLKDLIDEEIIDNLEDEPDDLDEIPRKSSLPAIQEEVKIGLGKVVATAIMLVVMVLLGVIYSSDVMDSVAMHDTEGLALSNFKIEKKLEGNKVILQVQGILLNESEKTLLTPDINVTILTKAGRVMGELIIPVEQDKIKADEKIIIKSAVSNISHNADRVIMDIGNSWELYFR